MLLELGSSHQSIRPSARQAHADVRAIFSELGSPHQSIRASARQVNADVRAMFSELGSPHHSIRPTARQQRADVRASNKLLTIHDYLATATHITAALFFTLCAFLQLNDPDPIIWILMYTCGGIIPATYAAIQSFHCKDGSLSGTARSFAVALPAALFAGAIPAVISVAQNKGGGAPFYYSEPVREVSGCFLVLVWLALGPLRERTPTTTRGRRRTVLLRNQQQVSSSSLPRAALVAAAIAAFVAWRAVVLREQHTENIATHCKSLLI